MKQHAMSDRIEAGGSWRHVWWGSGVVLAMLAVFAVGTAAAGDAPSSAVRSYGESIRGSKELLGYWPLANSLKADAGSLELVSTKSKLSRTAGPFGGSCVDLSDGNDLAIQPNKALDETRMSIEIIFKIVKVNGWQSLSVCHSRQGWNQVQPALQCRQPEADPLEWCHREPLSDQ